jgi:hypothetical protein
MTKRQRLKRDPMNPDVGAGIEISGVALAVVRLAYMAGAKYATDRCETEHHFPKGSA